MQRVIQEESRKENSSESGSNNTSNIKERLVKEIQANPMKVKVNEIEALDWPHIHFVLSAQYAKAVLKKRAYIPV
jgi:hypothetical protein